MSDTSSTDKDSEMDSDAPATQERPRERTTEHSPSFWLSDGSIILSAVSRKDTTRTMLFRVHQSVLARQSAVFHDMLSLAVAGVSDADKYEGLPKVVMPDSAEDIECLLRIVYGDPWYVANPHATITSVTILFQGRFLSKSTTRTPPFKPTASSIWP